MSSWTKYFSLAAVLICASAFSQDSNIGTEQGYDYGDTSQVQENPTVCSEPCPPCLSCAYNSSGRIQVNSPWDVSLSGSYILWQAKQQGMEYGFSFPLNKNVHIDPLNMESGYQSGFKIAICSKFDHDHWSVNIEYARLHLKNRGETTSLPSGYLIPINIFYADAEEDLFTNNHARYCKNKWNLTYDMIDLECGRPSYIGTHLILTPFYGIRGGWIEQKLNAKAQFTNLDEHGIKIYEPHSYSRSNSWLLGPRIGVDSSWLLGCRIKFYGNISASLDYQYFKTSFKQDLYSDMELLDINAKDKIGYVTPNIDIALGLGWGLYCNQNKWHIEISALYDFLYFWNQNYMRQFSDKALHDIFTKQGNLTLNGLTATLKFDF